MPTSDRGSDRRGRRAVPARHGFTLIELLVVLAIVAIASGLVTVALRDGAQSRLDEEGARLASLLEAARAEARAAGVPVRWETAQPGTTDPQGADFHFVGLSADLALPTRWLRAGTQAEVVGARAVILGPEPILPPQRIVLRLEDRSLMLSSDGLAPFAPATTP